VKRSLYFSNASFDSRRFEIRGFYRQGYTGGPRRPFVQMAVSLPRFNVVRQVDMLVDSGADITTLQPKDSLLLLEEAQFSQLSEQHKVQGIGGFTTFFREDAAIGVLLTGGHICWIPIVIDISELNAQPGIPSILGNDVMQFGITHLDAINGAVIIELWLPHPLVT
jgi:hypothetical protein